MKCSVPRSLLVTFLIAIFFQIFMVWQTFTPHGCHAALAVENKTDKVCAEVVALKPLVERIRTLYKIDSPWPTIPVQENREARHVLQKCFEVLEKINRLRQIKGLGEITIPPYPARDITPDEVHDLVRRLADELSLILGSDPGQRICATKQQPALDGSFNDVYRELWAISEGFDPVLGIRGFTPNDVYALSQQIMNEIKFLRESQNINLDVPLPALEKGRHPNHALKAAADLMAIIGQSQRNLWLVPVSLIKVPRRVITSSDVYDSLLGILAELQRIKYRLGLGRIFPLSEVGSYHSSDDIIRNLQWAGRLMPMFPLDKTLNQYDRNSLVKSPSHVFRVAKHILMELRRYKESLGIRMIAKKDLVAEGLASMHVYSKTAECLQQVNQIRLSKGLGAIAVASPPLRTITPREVYDLAARLDMELEVIYRTGGFPDTPWYLDDQSMSHDKTPSDVYNTMQLISRELDILLGSRGYSPDDVFRLTEDIRHEVVLILNHLKYEISESDIPLTPNLSPKHTLIISDALLDIVKNVQYRAGMLSPFIPMASPTSNISPNDVYNKLQLIFTELVSFKVHLRISDSPPKTRPVQDKTPSHVEQNLRRIISLLKILQGQGTTVEVDT